MAEAELGAAFQNAQKAAEFRNTLEELGYPQQPTTIMIDNTVAEGPWLRDSQPILLMQKDRKAWTSVSSGSEIEFKKVNLP